MAHELDDNKLTGSKAMFSVKETPWHREGIILNDAPAFADAMRLAGCDYDVVVRDLFIAADDVYSPTNIGKAVVRLDTMQTLGVVRDRYVPLANRDAFGILEPLIDAGVCKLETGGTLRSGRDAWMMARFTVSNRAMDALRDEVLPFALVTNNHSGEAKCLLMETPVRVVCANTLGMAVRGWQDRTSAISVAHRGDARVKVVDAAKQLFGRLTQRYDMIADQYDAMRATRLTIDQFTSSVLDSAAPLPKLLGELDGQHLTSRGYDLAFELAKSRRNAITYAWHKGSGHLGDSSAWEAYNGAVEVIDHDVELFKTYKSRVSSLMQGKLLDAKSKVLNSVMQLCGSI